MGETSDSAAWEVMSDMRDHGTSYFTVGIASGEEAELQIIECPQCGADRIVTTPENPDDDDLDSFTELGGEDPPQRIGPRIR